MGSVVELRLPTEGQQTLSLPVNDLVNTLEEYLVKAKTGQLRAMAFACITDTGEVYTGSKSAMDEAHRITLIGALGILSNRLAM